MMVAKVDALLSMYGAMHRQVVALACRVIVEGLPCATPESSAIMVEVLVKSIEKTRKQALSHELGLN